MTDFDQNFDLELRLLLEGVYVKYQHDFRQYSVASLRRRIQSAMVKFDCQTVSQLQGRILHEPDVFAQMLQFFTVQVSEMFRDPAYFRAIRERLVPVLHTYPSVKIWIAGCSTGEEVWSMAVLLDEEGLLDRTLIYATDINTESLEKAAAGIYSLERMPGFILNYQQAGGKGSLADYFTTDHSEAMFDRRLKKRMVFADHSLATDSVFSEMQFVSCRNVLIYFRPELQERAIQLFSESLVHKGFLGLGSKETLRFNRHADLFAEFAPAERIYQRS
ncbi:MAG TPA: CheR family methyltransferase [Telluria sp.]|nr:CheR family methyltransferase [Telluria sp.]